MALGCVGGRSCILSRCFKSLFSVCFIAVVQIFCLSASAQSEDEDTSASTDGGYEMETVTVTAQRTEDSLLEVPISITAFSSEDLEKYQITNIKDLEVRTPGLQFGLDSPATIRGIGSLYRGVGGDVAVAQYSNDLYFDEPYGVVSSLYDIERVEVLRGPQGTLYGRNAVAGAINYINKRPEFDFDVGYQAELSSFNGYRLNGFVTGPISETLAYRLTVETQSSDGNQENISGPDIGGRGDLNIAPQITFKTESLNVNVRYAHFEQDSASELRVPVRYPDTSVEFHPNPQDGNPSEERNTYYMYPRSAPPATAGGDLRNIVDLNSGGNTDVLRDAVTLHADYQFNPSTNIRYILGASSVSIGLHAQDSDGTSIVGSAEDRYLSSHTMLPFSDSIVYADFDVDILTHELHLSFDTEKSSTLLGVFYMDQDTSNVIRIFNRGSRAANTSTDDLLMAFTGMRWLDLIGTDKIIFDPENPNEFLTAHVNDGSGQQINLENMRTVEASALFGQTSYTFNEAWSANAGLRFTRDIKNLLQDDVWFAADFDIFGFRGDPPDFRLTDPARYNQLASPQEETFKKVTGHLAVDYQRSENELLYGRIASGYRSGGISPGAPEGYEKYDDEELIAYELGYKADLQEDRLRLLISGYVYDFANYQQPVLIRLFEPTLREVFVIENLPNTSLFGLEVEGTYHFDRQFSVTGFYAYQNSSLGEIMVGDPVNPAQTFENVTVTNPINGQTETRYLSSLFDLEGNELPNMPNHKWSLTGNYQRSLANGSNLVLSTTYSFTGERFNRIHNIPNDVLDSYGRWDANATWTSESGEYTASFFIENILDSIGMMELESNGWDAGYYQDATLTDPRFIGVVLTWNRK